MSVRIRSRVRGQANKTVVDPMKFMMDSGILFHMNHCVLHPLGLAIVGNMTKDGLCFELVDRRTNPNTVFADEDMSVVYVRGADLYAIGRKEIARYAKEGIDLSAFHGVQVVVTAEGATRGLARIDTDIDAAETLLMLAPETNGEVAVRSWAALSRMTGRDHTHLALPKEDEKIRFRDIQAQPRKIISSPIWSGLESEHVCYNAGYTNVHELIPWRTLTGRQQLYQDHKWMRAFGEALCVYRPPIDTKAVKPLLDQAAGQKHVILNFITPHQKWGIHSTYTDNQLMLTLSRGGPIVWMSEVDAAKAGLVDNDWVETFNSNGALVARVVVSQRMKEGTLFMYHAQEKIVNVPGSPLTGQRGGIHNSVTRAILKPTHMIGGYVQQAYGFNYYGTVGSNRDEYVIVRKLEKVDWLEGPLAAGENAA